MVKDFRDLTKLLALCRKQGVTAIELECGEVTKITLGELPPAEQHSSRSQDEFDPANPYSGFPQGELTPEQLMFYSSGGSPENDPVLKGVKET